MAEAGARLRGKVAVVTGASRGIGLAIARALAAEGCGLALAARGMFFDVSGKVAEHGGTVLGQACDVAREEDVARFFAAVKERLGRVDILVNNAGVAHALRNVEELAVEDWRRVLDTNLTGMFLCSRYASQAMIEKKQGGCIINIASIEAVHPSYAGMSAYDASKGGVLMLTKSLARELGPYGIRVNAIAHGGIMTQGVRSNIGGSSRSKADEKSQLKELKAFISRMALGRMGRADDIARVALFLASALADYITGDMIVVDGGYLVS